ncbi:TPA: hypothetical protein N0F65_007088 [Lagenidium giganteum]|uniref:CobW/HypB/UreG nucleotide-binding domain-containing protein n=1 Tax=Lagenidium giganteum TaxID=4803 RepID=A0AAV2YQ84_9STRA|nr:TPA: hypothetical protein N0F65_007088 [Lagenidium giganteum]
MAERDHHHEHGHGHDHHHEHGHGHDHHHDHDHSHAHDHEHGVVSDPDEVVRRFKLSRGRDPTPDEDKQLREHGHTHEHYEHAGLYEAREGIKHGRDYHARSFTVGIGGPVGSGKTALMLALCRALKDKYSIAAVTNDIFTREDGEFLVRHEALPTERILAIETGGCPHAAIREDISANLQACENLTDDFNTELLLVESGGDNLAANFSRELADYIIYVIDVAGGDKVPRKGGPGITQADLLVINKIDLSPYVGADLGVMDRDARKMRGSGPTVFAQINAGNGISTSELEKYVSDTMRQTQAFTQVLGDLRTVAEKYAHDYGKLSHNSVLAKRRPVLAKVPALYAVCSRLEQVLQACAATSSELAHDWNVVVMAPLDAFLMQQHTQNKQLLCEIYEAVQKESAFGVACASLIEPVVVVERAGPESNQVEEEALVADEKTQRKESKKVKRMRQRQLRELRNKQAKERDVIRQRLEELRLTEQQRLQFIKRLLLRIYDHFGRMAQRSIMALDKLIDHREFVEGDSGAGDDDVPCPPWQQATKEYDLHVEMTVWMAECFAQLIPLEDTMVRRLQALAKPSSGNQRATVATVFPEALVRFKDDFVLVRFHKQLAAHILDPICRTLKFSKQKQETIRKELVQSLEETKKTLRYTQTKLKDKETKLHQQQQQQMHINSNLGGSKTDSHVLHLSNFGLRSAVASLSRMHHSPRARGSLTASAGTEHLTSEVRDPMPDPAAAARLKGLEKDVEDARTYVASLERNEDIQAHELIKTLRNTSMIGIKTMELMVEEHVKRLRAAFTLLADTMTAFVASAEQSMRPEVDVDHSFAWRSWVARVAASDYNLDEPAVDGSDDEDEDVNHANGHRINAVSPPPPPPCSSRTCPTVTTHGVSSSTVTVVSLGEASATKTAVETTNTPPAVDASVKWVDVVLALCVLFAAYTLWQWCTRTSVMQQDWMNALAMRRTNLALTTKLLQRL